MAKDEKKTDQSPPAPAAEPSTFDAIKALAEAISKNGQPSPLDMAGISKERQDALMGKTAKPMRFKRVPGRSQDTEATFTMIVVESRKYPTGRVVRLEDYKEPAGCFTPVSQGGRVPDGATIWADGQHHQPDHGKRPPKNAIHAYHRQYLYETYWKADLGRIVGKALRVYDCLTPAAFEMPWEESTMFAVEEEDAA